MNEIKKNVLFAEIQFLARFPYHFIAMVAKLKLLK